MGFGEIIMQALGFNRPFAPYLGEKVARGRMRGFIFDQTRGKGKERSKTSPLTLALSPESGERGQDRTGQ